MSLNIKSRRKIIGIKNYLLITKTYKIYILSILGIFFYAFLLYIISLLFFDLDEPFKETAPFKNTNIIVKIFSVIILAPLLETFIFQFLIIEGLFQIKLFKNRILLVIFTSALIFGLCHFYGLYYVIYTFGIGVIFNSFYSILKLRGEISFLHTFFLHCIFNLIVFIGGLS